MLPVQAQKQQYDVTGKYMVSDVHAMMCMIYVMMMMYI